MGTCLTVCSAGTNSAMSPSATVVEFTSRGTLTSAGAATHLTRPPASTSTTPVATRAMLDRLAITACSTGPVKGARPPLHRGVDNGSPNHQGDTLSCETPTNGVKLPVRGVTGSLLDVMDPEGAW